MKALVYPPTDDMPRRVVRHRVAAVLAGRMPAEALPTEARHQLVRRLVVDEGCTDVEVAQRLTMTTYTAARIRTALHLRPGLGSRQAATG